jgi:acyl-CoA synthetase (AMP-forming)/AMP-acid ligase II
VLQSYGLSELLFVATQRPDDPPDQVSVGRLLPGVTVDVRDDDGRPMAGGGDGEIHVQTPYLLSGYLDYDTGKPDPIARDTWFATGDIGHVHGDELFITARKKDLIIRAGMNISPRAVEDVLLTHAAIAEAAVVGIPDPIYGEQVIAALVWEAGATPDAIQTVRELCRVELGSTAPAAYVTFDRLPTSVAGKPQKHVIRRDVIAKLERGERW